MYRQIKYRDQSYQVYSKDLLFQNDRQDYLFSAQKIIENLSLDIEHINNSIVSRDGEVEFIENLEGVAKESGLSIEINSILLETNPKLASSSVSILRVRAKTKGSWSDSYLFLSRLESLPYKVKINKFGLVNSSEVISGSSRSNSVWQSSFEIDVLKYK